MIALILSTALAQDTRLEITITDDAVGGGVTTDIVAFELEDAVLGGGLGSGGGGPRRTLSPVTVQRPVDATTSALLTASRTGDVLDTVALRVWMPHPGGAGELLLQEVQLTGAVVATLQLTGRATDPVPRERIGLSSPCVSVTGFSYDAGGAQTGASTYTWDYVNNAPGCTP